MNLAIEKSIEPTGRGPVPSCASNASLEVQWRDLTDEEIADVYEEHWLDHARAVIAKFKEVNT